MVADYYKSLKASWLRAGDLHQRTDIWIGWHVFIFSWFISVSWENVTLKSPVLLFLHTSVIYASIKGVCVIYICRKSNKKEMTTFNVLLKCQPGSVPFNRRLYTAWSWQNLKHLQTQTWVPTKEINHIWIESKISVRFFPLQKKNTATHFFPMGTDVHDFINTPMPWPLSITMQRLFMQDVNKYSNLDPPKLCTCTYICWHIYIHSFVCHWLNTTFFI